MATRIDTLRTFEAIHDAGIAAPAARAITEAIEVALSVSHEKLVTKPDVEHAIERLWSDLEKAISQAQLKTTIWIGGMMLAVAGVLLAGFHLL